jgi:hypothetical protein
VNAVLRPRQVVRETLKCRSSFGYFVDTYCWLLSGEDGAAAAWKPFHLWPAQLPLADALQAHRLIVLLKARQLGMTALAAAFALWTLLLKPVATVMLFSRRDREAVDLLRRLRDMHGRLPDWLQSPSLPDAADNDHEWVLGNGSRALAFPANAGDSYTASLVVIDEADLCPDLAALMGATKPTIDAGGRMLILSRSDKRRPNSPFKMLYRAARLGQSPWVPLFLPWSARPGRDEAWYAEQAADSLTRTGSLDYLHEMYPANDAEALAPRTLDKRLPSAWLHQCYEPLDPLPTLPADAPSLPGLEVYRLPVERAVYVVAADPAEGNPTSDDSALTVLDASTGEEVAALAAKLEPAAFAQAIDAMGQWYNQAAVMVERGNHGHAVILWLWEHSALPRLCGHDGKEGWLTSVKGKALMYAAAADAFRNGEVVLHSFATFVQLSSVDGNTLSAPEGEKDDRAVSFAIAAATVGVARGWQAEGE